MMAQTKDCTPYRDVEIVDDGVIVTYRFRGAIHQQDPLYPDAKFWRIPGFGQNSIAGEPAYPFRWDTFAIPDGATAEVEMMESEYTDTIFTLAPAYPPLLMSDTIGYNTDIVIPISLYSGLYPQNNLRLGDVQYYRGQALIRVCIMPVQYNISLHVVRSYHLIQYKLKYVNKDGTRYSSIAHRDDTQKPMDKGTERFLSNITLNYSKIQKGTRERNGSFNGRSSREDNRGYLIVTRDKFLNAVNEFAEWKRTKGVQVYIESRNNWNSPDSVKAVIKNKYYQTDGQLNYLLIVGKTTDVPTFEDYYNQHSHTGLFPSDYPYYEISDSLDYLPELLGGRIIASSNSKALDIFTKIINYEKNPIILPSFYNTGLHCAFFQDEQKYENGYLYYNTCDSCEDMCMTLASEDVRNNSLIQGKNIERIYSANSSVFPLRWNNGLFAYGDTIPVEIQRPNFNWNGTTNDIIQRIKAGVFYVLYSGHGQSGMWMSPALSTWSVDNSLDNNNKYPVVFSMACLTGKFDDSNGCLAESFLSKANGGSVSFIGASYSMPIDHDMVLTNGIFDAIWPNPGLRPHFPNSHVNFLLIDSIETPTPTYELGQILTQGKARVIETFGHTSYTRSVSKMFHLFGDPSMMMYTDVPEHFQNPQIIYQNGKIKVHTTENDTRISFYSPQNNTVDSYIGNYVEYPTTADSVIVCLDKHNYIPYIQTYQKDLFIQNETINEQRSYVGKTILVGNHVTNTKPTGDVIIQGADVKLEGESVTLMPGTTIINSDVRINTQ